MPDEQRQQGQQDHTAADPANPTSTGRVGGPGGVSTAGKGGEGVRQPEGFEGGVTNEGENVHGHQELGSHIAGIRKGEEIEAEEGQEPGHVDKGSSHADRPAGGGNVDAP